MTLSCQAEGPLARAAIRSPACRGRAPSRTDTLRLWWRPHRMGVPCVWFSALSSPPWFASCPQRLGAGAPWRSCRVPRRQRRHLWSTTPSSFAATSAKDSPAGMRVAPSGGAARRQASRADLPPSPLRPLRTAAIRMRSRATGTRTHKRLPRRHLLLGLHPPPAPTIRSCLAATASRTRSAAPTAFRQAPTRRNAKARRSRCAASTPTAPRIAAAGPTASTSGRSRAARAAGRMRTRRYSRSDP